MFGFWLAFQLATRLAYAVEGLSRDELLSSDCDDCDLTVLLDAWWVVLLVMVGYLVLAVLVLRSVWTGGDPPVSGE